MTRIYAQAGLFASLLALDQWTKWLILQPDFKPFVVIDGFFNMVKAFNTGVAFSMFDDLPESWRVYALVGATSVIAIVVAVWWWRERHQPGNITWLLVLILAGAAGNIWDRIQLGYVVDFIEWYVRIDGVEYRWPAFNVADSCISVAVVLLLVSSIRKSP